MRTSRILKIAAVGIIFSTAVWLTNCDKDPITQNGGDSNGTGPTKTLINTQGTGTTSTGTVSSASGSNGTSTVNI